MSWRVLVYKEGEDGITRFRTLEDAMRYVQAIKDGGVSVLQGTRVDNS